ncbi:MAG: hypothetical protein U1F16_05690 [Turneriella sp.]
MRRLLALCLFCCGAAVFAAEEATDEDEIKSQWHFLLREEPGIGLKRSDSLLNPDDILGFPRLQNRVLASVDAKIPLIKGGGVNPIGELVIADTFLYLQHEGSEPTIAKPQIADARNFLKELYFNVRPREFWLITLGRRNITDGVGYSRNVVDFLANPTTLPGANFDNRYRIKNREGSILLRNEFLWKGGAASYTYVPEIGVSSAEDAKLRTEIDRLTQFNRNAAHWLKVYQFAGGFDISLHYFYQRRHNVGLALAKVLGEALELHGEARLQRGSSLLDPVKLSEDTYFAGNIVAPALYSFENRPDDTWYLRGLIGAQYTFENKLNLSAEYYHNGEGYSPSRLNTLYNGLELANARYASSAFVLPQGNPYRLFLLSANLNFNYLSMGQHYAFMRLADPEFFRSNKWEAAAYTSVMLSDGSGMTAGELIYKINDRFELQMLVNGFFGSKRTEGGLFYQGMAALLALEVQF